MTDYLWQLRKDVLEAQLGADKTNPSTPADTSIGIPTKPTNTEANYMFSKDSSLQEKYNNPWGTIRIGRVLEDLDALAGNIAFKHCCSGKGAEEVDDIMLVTASIDRVVLTHRANLKDDITLRGRVAWVGSSSMEIEMEACSSWTKKPWLRALFTFVARSRASGVAAKINPLLVEEEEDVVRFAAGKERAAHRKKLRKQSGETRMKRQFLETIIRLETEGTDAAEAGCVSIKQAAAALFAKSRPKIAMPVCGLNGTNSVRLSDTALSNTQIMQPQQRNTAGRIFGGFLVRRAYELAFSTAYLFGGVVPRFVEIDEVVFRRPVDVGDLLRYESCVLFASSSMHANPSIHVEVLASVINPGLIDSAVSNSFNFTFEVPKGTALPDVVPETKEDALKIVTRYYSDLVQNYEDQDRERIG